MTNEATVRSRDEIFKNIFSKMDKNETKFPEASYSFVKQAIEEEEKAVGAAHRIFDEFCEEDNDHASFVGYSKNEFIREIEDAFDIPENLTTNVYTVGDNSIFVTVLSNGKEEMNVYVNPSESRMSITTKDGEYVQDIRHKSVSAAEAIKAVTSEESIAFIKVAGSRYLSELYIRYAVPALKGLNL